MTWYQYYLSQWTAAIAARRWQRALWLARVIDRTWLWTK